MTVFSLVLTVLVVCIFFIFLCMLNGPRLKINFFIKELRIFLYIRPILNSLKNQKLEI